MARLWHSTARSSRALIIAFCWANPSTLCPSNTTAVDYNDMNENNMAGHRFSAIPCAWSQRSIWIKLAAWVHPGLSSSSKPLFPPCDKDNGCRNFLINKVFSVNLLLGLRSQGLGLLLVTSAALEWFKMERSQSETTQMMKRLEGLTYEEKKWRTYICIAWLEDSKAGQLSADKHKRRGGGWIV